MASIAPAHRATPQMTHTPDPDPTPQAPTGDPAPAQAQSDPASTRLAQADPAAPAEARADVAAAQQARVDPANPVDPAAEAKPARPGLRDQIAENPLLSLFVGLTLALPTFLGTVVAALLIFTLGGINDRLDSLGERIDGVEGSLGGRIDNLEDKMDAGFAAQGAQIAELDRKLTALIAHLNAAEAVDAALEHRLLVPDGGTLEPGREPSGRTPNP